MAIAGSRVHRRGRTTPRVRSPRSRHEFVKRGDQDMANELRYGTGSTFSASTRATGATSTSTEGRARRVDSTGCPPRRSPTATGPAAPGRSSRDPARPPARRSGATTSSACATSRAATAATSTSAAASAVRRHPRRHHRLRQGPRRQQQPLAVFDTTSTPGDGLVRFNGTVQLWNTYANRGGFLETNGGGSASGARFGIDTNAYANRSSSNVTFWKVPPAT